MGTFGLQLYSVREAAADNLVETISLAADMGYQGIQFAGFFQTPAKKLKRLMDDKRIDAAGSHTGLDELVGDKLKETMAYNQEIGNSLLICPWLPEKDRKTKEDYQRTAEKLNEIGQRCKDNGMTFAYHNHHFEFETFGGETGFDLLFGQTDPEFVQIELDCFWATYAGYEPTDIINKYGNRIVSLHIKDMKEENEKKRSIEIGSGILDLKTLLRVGKEHDVEWFIVEQEDFNGNPLESARVNIDNLNKIF
ncbi:sugar phosphate isomerase/epimerase family protein [Oceanobacillus timonensis]|uniref:sugar phosphate isomerase/epimerase family protein n=1 Tax=Oceanobacillus timonensis TaxID=1926285 RepID=UPI0009B98378|nr:sugar phosphate isomerase/epimerase [Oceanobacillus timonensis]